MTNYACMFICALSIFELCVPLLKEYVIYKVLHLFLLLGLVSQNYGVHWFLPWRQLRTELLGIEVPIILTIPLDLNILKKRA